MKQNYSFGYLVNKGLIIIATILIAKFLIGGIYSLGRDSMISKYKYEKNLSAQSNYKIEKILSIITDSINKKCPMALDSKTTLLNTTTFQGKEFQYNYETNIDTSNYNMNILKQRLRKYISNSFINTPNCKNFKEMKVTLIYSYTNAKGEFLFNIKFAPDNYE